MISTVIVTYNDGALLEGCLESVAGKCDEIVLVDLGSSDKTLKIAKDFNAKIFTHSKVDFVEMVRNFAVSKAMGEWILVLDPDERIPQDVWVRLKEIVEEDKYKAVSIPRKNIFFGKWIVHSNWWPDRHVRFFKRGAVSWSNKIHAYPKVEGKVYELAARKDLAIIHYGYTSLSQFMDRQNRYSEIEAKNLYDSGIRFSWTYFFWKPAREFLVRYLRHAGFLDGFYGFALTFLMMVYQLEVMIKLWELEKNQT